MIKFSSKEREILRLPNKKSRMKREFQVRFCERLGLKCPCLLDFAGAKERKEKLFNLTLVRQVIRVGSVPLHREREDVID